MQTSSLMVEKTSVEILLIGVLVLILVIFSFFYIVIKRRDCKAKGAAFAC